MNKAEQEGMRRAFQRAYNNGNQRWNFNGRTFETRMEVYRSNVSISAYFESSVKEVTVWMNIGRVFRKLIDVDGPQKTFHGENAMFDALNYLADCFMQTIDEIKSLEQEALMQVTPQISPQLFENIFARIKPFDETA